MLVSIQARQLLRHPAAFTLRTLSAFRANQGLLLAGAVAYYALLSIVPLLILIVIALSHIDRSGRAAGDGEPLSRVAGAGAVEGGGAELANFLAHRGVMGGCCW